MSRTIVAKFLACAFVIVPAFYCAPSWAEPLVAKGAAEVEEAAQKLEERPRDDRKKMLEEGRDEGLRKAVESVLECAKENRIGEDCKDNSKK
jgi:hypothetical protein